MSITDDAGTPADTTDDWTLTKTSGYVSGDTDNDGALDLTEVWVFTRTGVALQGQYANIAVVSAQAADNANQPITALGTFTHDDPSHYWGLTSGLTLKKFTNGFDADTAPGPLVAIGSTVTWTYKVTNTGNTPLTTTVTDDKIADDTTINCGQGTANVVTIPGDQTVTCTATGIAASGQYANTGTAAATAPATYAADGTLVPGVALTSSDSSHYLAPATTGVTIVKSLNGNDANTTPGVSVTPGQPVAVTFAVTNTGTAHLANVAVTDSDLTTITCPGSATNTPHVIPLLGPAGSDTDTITCTATLPALTAGATHTNTATATGTPTLADGTTPAVGTNGQPLPAPNATDPAHAYAPATTGVTIVKSLNGNDANTTPGVSVTPGQPVAVTFAVTNTGTAHLANVAVTDSDLTTITCPGSATNTPHVIPLLGPAGSDTDTITCTATLPALTAGATHTNTATTTGTPTLADGTTPAVGTNGQPLPAPNATDPAHAYAPATTGVTIVKSLNGNDANTTPGVSVTPGQPVAVTFAVTNTGTAHLANVAVTDSDLTTITCPGSATNTPHVIPLLGPAGSDTDTITCTATLPALTAGATHTNTATATGTPTLADGTTPAVGTNGQPLPAPNATDPAHAYAPATTGVTIVKSLNGNDANTTPGVSVTPGQPVAVTFAVTNTGTAHLANVAVTDSDLTTITCPGSATNTPHVIPLLGPAGSDTDTITCTATLPALTAGATHTNTATATGTPTLADGTTPAVGTNGQPLPAPNATDPAHAYAPATSGVTIVKSLNGNDANTAPGVSVTPGQPVTVTFAVTNTGTAHLANVAVTDSDLTTITCPGSDTNTPHVIPLLGPAGSDTDTITCTATLPALTAGATHTNTATTTGTPTLADGTTPAVGTNGQPLPPATDTDDAHAYAPATSGVTIVKSLNDNDANTAPGVSVTPGQPVTVTFAVTNTGTAHLANVAVTDSDLTTITCPGSDTNTPHVIPLLGPAGSDTDTITCTATLPALAAGATHTNTATTTGTPTLADGTTPAVGTNGQPLPPATDTDDAHAYAPATTGVTIVKSLNGNDANTAPGVSVTPGQPVTVTFVVTNTGTAHLANVAVTDSDLTTITCPGSDTNTPHVIPLLGPAGSDTDTITCTATLPALAAGATHTNTATTTGTPTLADGTTPAVGTNGQPLPPATDTDDAHAYAPARPGLSVVKRINGTQAGQAPGVSVLAGSTMNVTFEVTNTGDVRIDPVVVSDDTGTAVSCPLRGLNPGETMTCTATLPAPALGAQHVNRVRVSGSPVLPDGFPAVGPGGTEVAPPEATDTAYAISVAQPLPQTGTNVGPPLVGGVGLLVSGLMLFLASRRRPRRQGDSA
ncbi:MAG: LPXTG cell wall anchor domain-containing protein [Dermatophilaceae bacterium]